MIPRSPLSTDREYDARIVSRTGPADGVDIADNIQYSAMAVNTEDVVRVGPVAPYRRLFVGSQSIRIKAAEVGDACRIQIRGGEIRLICVEESYLIAQCAPPTTANPS